MPNEVYRQLDYNNYDNIFYFGECEIIGNMPIDPNEDNYTIHYGRSIDAHETNYLYYQSGKTYVALKGEKELYPHSSGVFGGFSNKGIGWDLHIQLPILLECIKKKSNEPYWDMIPDWRVNQDLRNPKFKKELKQIKKQMGIK